MLILGLAALVRPFTVHSDVLRRELPLMLLVSVVAGSVLYDGQLSRSDGIFLLFGCASVAVHCHARRHARD